MNLVVQQPVQQAVQQPRREGIASTGGVNHWHPKGGQLATAAGEAPTQRRPAVGHHHIRALRQGGAHHGWVVAAKQPAGFLGRALDQGGLQQQGGHGSDLLRRGTASGIRGRIPEGGAPIHIEGQAHAGRRGLTAGELQG